MRWCSLGMIWVAALLIAACSRYPDDPEHTLKQVLERGKLRVGIIHSPPWTIVDDGRVTGGVEVALVKDFASALGVKIEWHPGGAPENFEALERYELDMLIGGLLQSNPWKSHAGFTMPYYTRPVLGNDDKHQHVMAVPPGENAMIMRLEKFLLGSTGQDRIENMLAGAQQ